MSLKDAYSPNLKKASNSFHAAAGTVKNVVKKVVTKLSTPRDISEGGKYRVDRVGDQIIRTKKVVKKI